MTREEVKEELDFCERVVSENIVFGTYEGYPCWVVNDLMDKIFDEHEAQIVQIKTEAEHDQRNSAMSQKESLLLLEQLQAKENHIVELNNMVMEKNEIIDVLHILSSGFNDLYDDYRKLSRKIVAMLFWECKKALRISNNNDVPNFHGKSTQSFYLFKKAYAMLKGE